MKILAFDRAAATNTPLAYWRFLPARLLPVNNNANDELEEGAKNSAIVDKKN